MQKALLPVILLGAGIGLMMPSAKSPAPALAAVAEGQPEETLLERKDNGHFYVTADVNGHLVNFLVDTGASTVALTIEDAERLGVEFSRSAFTVVGTGASGPVRGQLVTLDSVVIDGKAVSQVDGAVIEGLDISLLGQAYLSRISSVQMSGDYMSLR